MTLNENVADLGAIKAIVKMYEKWMLEKPPAANLPGISYNHEQIMFINAAQVRTIKSNPMCPIATTLINAGNYEIGLLCGYQPSSICTDSWYGRARTTPWPVEYILSNSFYDFFVYNWSLLIHTGYIFDRIVSTGLWWIRLTMVGSSIALLDLDSIQRPGVRFGKCYCKQNNITVIYIPFVYTRKYFKELRVIPSIPSHIYASTEIWYIPFDTWFWKSNHSISNVKFLSYILNSLWFNTPYFVYEYLMRLNIQVSVCWFPSVHVLLE